MELKDYLKLNYTYEIKHMNDESGQYYYGRVLELDGCQSTADTYEELGESLKEAIEGYIETKLASGHEVPLPFDAQDYSGKLVVRMPKSLHKDLALRAEKEGISLNQYLLYKLAK
ncbi:MAG: toxin-antitoxin system HicB family antitoxin [Oscillospiraceae bacterium]|nr:toxin-antitoxin system HicB family antitoxin [Oscillospiraceae bacterium]